MFLLTKKAFHKTKWAHAFNNDQAGAFASFEGRVRNQNDGAQVKRLEYEAYPALCETEAEKILEEARRRFSILDVRAFHRYGMLKIGDVAVWVGVLAAHREDAFAACRYIIDELKARLPIWKKEYYADKTTRWVNAQTPGTVFHPDQFYEKQLLLPEFKEYGQDKLLKARVAVIGAGGLGAAALQTLVASGVGTVGIVESDCLEESNLHRQTIYRHKDIGKPKIDLAAAFLQDLNPSVALNLYPYRLTAHNALDILSSYDIVVDASDNFATKFLLNDVCILLEKPLISASLYQWEGQLFVYRPKKTACLRCLWPERPPQGCVGTCTEAGIPGGVPAIFGHLQALEAVKQILNITGAEDGLLLYNLKTHRKKTIRLTADPDCPACGKKKTMTEITPEQYGAEDYNLRLQDLSDEQITACEYIDIREPVEYRMAPVEDWPVHQLPLSRWQDGAFTFEKEKKYIIFCAKGIRSLDLVEYLRGQGITNTYSLVGGIDAIKEVQRTRQIGRS